MSRSTERQIWFAAACFMLVAGIAIGWYACSIAPVYY